jgi:hypothetical protein
MSRRNRRRYRKERKHMFMRQLISYLTREKKMKEQEKVTDISDRLDKVSVSETNEQYNIQNIFSELTI